MLVSFEISMPILFPKLEPPWLLRWSLVLLLSYYQNSSPSVANGDVTFPHSPFHLNCPISTVSPMELVLSRLLCFEVSAFASYVKASYNSRKSVIRKTLAAAHDGHLQDLNHLFLDYLASEPLC